MDDFFKLSTKDIATLAEMADAWVKIPILDKNVEMGRQMLEIEDPEERKEYLKRQSSQIDNMAVALMEKCAERSEVATIMKAKLYLLKQQLQTEEELNSIVGGTFDGETKKPE